VVTPLEIVVAAPPPPTITVGCTLKNGFIAVVKDPAAPFTSSAIGVMEPRKYFPPLMVKCPPIASLVMMWERLPAESPRGLSRRAAPSTEYTTNLS
jgi:hypothetical protein